MQSDSESPRPDVLSRGCTSQDALHHLTGRWGPVTVVALKTGAEPVRFVEIRRRVEVISYNMLSQTLTHLERDGRVERPVRSSVSHTSTTR